MEPSTRPYLIRAIYEWAMDSGLTPQVLVDAGVDGVDVPDAYVNDGRIVLNIHAQAVRHLDLGNERLSFSARFGGRSRLVQVPVDAVLAVFARENGRGISFEHEPRAPTPPADGPTSGRARRAPRKKAPPLKLVK